MAGRPGRYSAILDVFTRLVSENGYDGTNFGTVAAELGISKGTIVHHFASKEGLLAALHETYMTRRLAELDLMFDRLEAPEERLAAVLHAFIHYQVEDRAATVAFQREIARLADDPTMAEGRRLRESYLRRIQTVVQQAVDTGVFRPVDVDVDALLVFGSAQWAWTWFRPDGDRTSAQVGEALVDLVLGGLLVDRTRLGEISSVDGRAATTMRSAIHDAPAHDPAAAAS